MKKLLTITVAALFGLAIINAQNVEFGAKAGLNLSKVTGENVDSFDSRTCFHLGVVAEIPLSDKFSFQPELLYSCQGAGYSEEENIIINEPSTMLKAAAVYEGTIKADYLNLPLMAKYYVTEGLSLEVGPQVGYLISAKDKYEYPGESGEDDIKEYLKSVDFGANFGLGYKLKNGVNFGARYNLGLSDNNDDPDLEDSKFKNSVFQFSVGYFF